MDTITQHDFNDILQNRFGDALNGARAVAVGLSGGPDSMALTSLLSSWAQERGIEVHALIVDHGLRPESAAEARQVRGWIQSWPRVSAHILQWEQGSDAHSRIQEQARAARYEMTSAYCTAQGIGCLFLGHHQDDQAETFLFRLAKGSGLDGLSGMRAVQTYGAGLKIVRPLLDVPKAQLVELCRAADIPYVEDPSNEAEKYARVRLRKSMAALEAEGLSSKRLAVTAHRLARARAALDKIAEESLENITLEKDTKSIVLNKNAFVTLHEEVALRVLAAVIKALAPDQDYLPRMEKLEDLTADMISENPFRKRTLGGLVFSRDDRGGRLVIVQEHDNL